MYKVAHWDAYLKQLILSYILWLKNNHMFALTNLIQIKNYCACIVSKKVLVIL